MDQAPQSFLARNFAVVATSICCALAVLSLYEGHNHEKEQAVQLEKKEKQERDASRNARKQEIERQAQEALQDGKRHGLAISNYAASSSSSLESSRAATQKSWYTEESKELDAAIAKADQHSDKNLQTVAGFVRKLQQNHPVTAQEKLERLQIINLFVNLWVKYDHTQNDKDLPSHSLLDIALHGADICLGQAKLKLYLEEKSDFSEKDSWVVCEKPALKDADGKVIGQRHAVVDTKIDEQVWTSNNWQRETSQPLSYADIEDIVAYNSRIDTVETHLKDGRHIPVGEFNARNAYELTSNNPGSAAAFLNDTPSKSLALDTRQVAALGFADDIRKAFSVHHTVIQDTRHPTAMSVAFPTKPSAKKPLLSFVQSAKAL